MYFHKNFTFSDFCESSFHFNALLNPSGHTVYKIMYKFVTHTVSYDTKFLISFSIFLRYFWLISSSMHPQTLSIESKSGLKLGHSNMVTFSPLNRCLWGLQHVFGLFTKLKRCNLVICVSLHTAGPPLLIIPCFNLLTSSLFSLLTSSAMHLQSAASNILAYQHLSCTVFPPILWWIVQLYTQ